MPIVVQVYGEHDLSALRIPADAERIIPHTPLQERTQTKLLLKTECQKCQCIETILTLWRARVTDHSKVTNLARKNLHFDVGRKYNARVPSILAPIGRGWSACALCTIQPSVRTP